MRRARRFDGVGVATATLLFVGSGWALAGCDARRAGAPGASAGATSAGATSAGATSAGAAAVPGPGDSSPVRHAEATPPVRCDGAALARTCTLTGILPDAAILLTTGDGVPDTLVVTVARAGGVSVRLPTFYGSRLWGQCAPATDARDLPRLDRIAAADIDGDGRDDLVLLAECMTGIGPTGAQPFPAGAVWFADGRGSWRSEERVDSALTDAAQAACADEARSGRATCDVRGLASRARRAVMGR